MSCYSNGSIKLRCSCCKDQPIQPALGAIVESDHVFCQDMCCQKIVQHCLHAPAFAHFIIMLICVGQTDGWTDTT